MASSYYNKMTERRPLRSACNLLTSLETVKSKEFAGPKLVFNQIPHLNAGTETNAKEAAKEESSVSGVKTLTKKRSRSGESSKTTELASSSKKKQKVNHRIVMTDSDSDSDDNCSINISKSNENERDTRISNENNNTLTDTTVEDQEPLDNGGIETAPPLDRPGKIKKQDGPKVEKDTGQEKKDAIANELMEKRKNQLTYINKFVDISVKYSQYLKKKITPSASGESSSSEKPSTPSQDHEKAIKSLKYFEGTLRPYQAEGVTWLMLLYENSINGILADEMGLGKTIQIIALFSYLYDLKVPGPFLIVTPLSTLGNWESEFERFAPKIPVVRFQGTQEEKKEQKKRILGGFHLNEELVKPVVLCSYQVPLTEDGFMMQLSWQYIVVDEAQRIKNADSKLSRQLRSFYSVNRILLTGTPLQNDITELWALFRFLMPELFKNLTHFASLLELDDVKDKKKLLEAEAATKLITTIHKVLAPFILRREKKLVLDDIVPKKEIILYCPLSEMQEYIYKAILQRDLHKLYMGTYVSKEEEMQNLGKRISKPTQNMRNTRNSFLKYFTKPVTFNKGFVPNNRKVPIDCPDVAYYVSLTMNNISMMMKKTVNHPYLVWTPLDPKSGDSELLIDEDLINRSGKLLVLDALLKKLKLGGHKVLVFSTLVVFMNLIEEMLIMRGYKYARLDGNSDYNDRNESIKSFNTNDDVLVFLLSTRAGGLGLNLISADTVIFMDRDWNPMVDLQAQDRCHRIGQTNPVMIYSLITQGTIDEVIVGRGEVKRRLEKVVLREGKFRDLKNRIDFDENGLKELEDLLNHEEKALTVKSNGLLYTDEELDAILDRSDLFKEMERRQEQN